MIHFYRKLFFSLLILILLVVGMLLFRPSFGTSASGNAIPESTGSDVIIRRPYYPIPRDIKFRGLFNGVFGWRTDPSFAWSDAQSPLFGGVTGKVRFFLVNQGQGTQESIFAISHNNLVSEGTLPNDLRHLALTGKFVPLTLNDGYAVILMFVQERTVGNDLVLVKIALGSGCIDFSART